MIPDWHHFYRAHGPGTIKFWRRLTQAVFFVLIVYGALIFRREVDVEPVLPTIPTGSVATSKSFSRGQILWASADKPVFDSYPPGAACRYNPNGGLVKACVVHFLSENLTWRTAFKYVLPHLLFFVFLAFLLGRWWCGWVCPLGALGDLLTWLRLRIGFGHVRTPAKVRKGLRVGSYGLLFSSFALSWMAGMKRFDAIRCNLFLPYCQICPGRIICPLMGGMAPSWRDFSSVSAGIITVAAWGVLGLFIMAFAVGRRIWCHVCPIGLMSSWFNRGGGLQIRKSEATHCNRCSACADACPMALTHVRETKESKPLATPECILCLRCVEICPREDCLKVSWFGLPITRSRLRSARQAPPKA